ncbi:calcium-dependent protein kinase [Plakobranchus ocellatus]|uniref:Calcium-dependent protein kinase n=1 Tax=Plakobranchus ocellatus TaxID=259542 RepID=A0AAV4BAY5_9GAST|nr:calcium-dependent protein kinase [Plakobranchus ocellatus]
MSPTSHVEVTFDEFLEVLGFDQSLSVLNQLFKQLDTDGSGFLKIDEIVNAINSTGELAKYRQKLVDLFVALASDADKKLSYHEFVEAWTKKKDEVTQSKSC